MYNTHKFTDPEAKAEGVLHNTIDMVFSYFWSQQQIINPKFTGMNNEEMSVTRAIIREWVEDHPAATITELADYCSRLIADYIENEEDKAEGNWEE